jgi:hypothetical protein
MSRSFGVSSFTSSAPPGLSRPRLTRSQPARRRAARRRTPRPRAAGGANGPGGRAGPPCKTLRPGRPPGRRCVRSGSHAGPVRDDRFFLSRTDRGCSAEGPEDDDGVGVVGKVSGVASVGGVDGVLARRKQPGVDKHDGRPVDDRRGADPPCRAPAAPRCRTRHSRWHPMASSRSAAPAPTPARPHEQCLLRDLPRPQS